MRWDYVKTLPVVSRIGLHFVRAKSVGVLSGFVVGVSPGHRRHRRPTETILPRRVARNEIGIRFRTIKNNGHACWCILLTYRHADCANKRTYSDK